MKRSIQTPSHHLHFGADETTYGLKGHSRKNGAWLLKAALMIIMVLLSISFVHAQSYTVSGQWDSFNATNNNANNGYNDRGNGVIQLLNTVLSYEGSAVHETSNPYNTAGGDFNKCFQVFFGCPGNDEMGTPGDPYTDTKGDGLAFSFWPNGTGYCITCGAASGGLGYNGANSKMITIEFDTYKSNYDNGNGFTYGNGATGNEDEISVHYNGDAQVNSELYSGNAGNLEDGQEHTMCITYTAATHKLKVVMDPLTTNKTLLDFDLGTTYNLATYFGNGKVNYSWSSGKEGASNPATVSDGVTSTSIAAQLGGTPLCPASVTLTSPANGATFSGCPVGPITLKSTVVPPANNTVSKVEYFDGTTKIGESSTGPTYDFVWASPTSGSRSLTAKATFVPSSGPSTTMTSPANVISVGGVQKTSTVPSIDGTQETLWDSYSSTTLTRGFNSDPDLAASYKIMYDGTNLYILVDVKDSELHCDGGNPWDRDGVEIYIDRGNDKPGGMATGDYQIGFAYPCGNGAPTMYGTAISGVSASWRNKTGGYIVEIKVPWTSVGFAAGQYPSLGSNTSKLGFDVVINDADSGTRNDQLSWNDARDTGYNNPSKWGTVEITDCDPLPVTLISFTGKLINGTTVLNWATASELNNAKFIIERSDDYTNWDEIGEVAGAGNANTVINYSFTDYNPFDGISYYRLRQIDIDGAFALSNVVVIHTTGQSGISISPNPFDDALTIIIPSKGEINVSIYDVVGRLLFTTDRTTENGTLVIQPDLPNGAYIITVKTDTLVEQRKIIKR